ncbi:MAG: hypothetical protein JSW27_21730 [Phycisphaerales bacterium]|nr:MAG: hypothetical protein JSW27_21730 [Phycisphaerales bacterium]
MDLTTTYYWKVDEVNEAEAISRWEGSFWSFTTEDFVVVDDFENYDDEEIRIFDTWRDGWVHETGSTVGHIQSPFAEQETIDTGRQSMSLFYDNTDLATAEAETQKLAIDDDTATKYLHRKGGSMATGLQVAPMLGVTVVTGLTLTTADDVPTRDPIAFELSGSNASIEGPYELIATGDVLDFAGEVERIGEIAP